MFKHNDHKVAVGSLREMEFAAGYICPVCGENMGWQPGPACGWRMVPGSDDECWALIQANGYQVSIRLSHEQVLAAVERNMQAASFAPANTYAYLMGPNTAMALGVDLDQYQRRVLLLD
ncbi:MAG: hypothetical protein JW900_07245 [Anaerolineae bacterium]|nr:hypothetical protein [Anaerolineae bacterium]